MTYSKIINPETGRKVSINGRLGKEILQRYINVLVGGSSKRQADLRRKLIQDSAKLSAKRSAVLAQHGVTATNVLNDFESEIKALEYIKKLNASNPNTKRPLISGPTEVKHTCTINNAADGTFIDDPEGCAGLDKLYPSQSNPKPKPKPKPKPTPFLVWLGKQKSKLNRKKSGAPVTVVTPQLDTPEEQWCTKNALNIYDNVGHPKYKHYLSWCDKWREENNIPAVYHSETDDDSDDDF